MLDEARPIPAPVGASPEHEVDAYDLLVDLSTTRFTIDELARHVRQLLGYGGFTTGTSQITVAASSTFAIADLPSIGGVSIHADGAVALERAIGTAAHRRRHLLVVIGTVMPSNQVVRPLTAALRADPMVGSAQPRFADAATDVIIPLPAPDRPDECDTGPTPRDALRTLVPLMMTPELPAACILLRDDAIVSIASSSRSGSLLAALSARLTEIRRRGFRNVVCNRAVVTLPPVRSDPSSALALDRSRAYPQLADDEAADLLERHPDRARATPPAQLTLLEALSSAAWPHGGAPRRLLVDCRGMADQHNGTSQCALGLLDGLAALDDSRWIVEVQSQPAAALFHDLAHRYPTWRHHHGKVSGAYAAAIAPNQPFAYSSIAELHRHARVTVFNLLDTIVWDVIYPTPYDVGPVWRLVGQHADGLAYISGYSRDRFRHRFEVAPCVHEEVIHLSLHADDYTRDRRAEWEPGEHVVLFGNEYDHKDLDPTLQLLADAFPFQGVVVVGGRPHRMPRVTWLSSGHTSAEEVHRLVATAKAVVYPSFYEGFGLPAIEGLAYGRDVLVRASPLWEELAACARLPGRLITFTDQTSLVTTLGRVVAGLPVEFVPWGGDVGSTGLTTWTEHARRMLRLVERCIESATPSRWIARDDVLRWAAG